MRFNAAKTARQFMQARFFMGLMMLTAVVSVLPCRADTIHIGDKKVQVRAKGSSLWVDIKDIRDICSDKDGEWILLKNQKGPKGEDLSIKIPKNVDVRIVAANGDTDNLHAVIGDDPTDSAFLGVLDSILTSSTIQPGMNGMILYPIHSSADPLLDDSLSILGNWNSLGFFGATRSSSDSILLVGSSNPAGTSPLLLSLDSSQSYGLAFPSGLPVLQISPPSTADAVNFMNPDPGNIDRNYLAFAASAVPESGTFALSAIGVVLGLTVIIFTPLMRRPKSGGPVLDLLNRRYGRSFALDLRHMMRASRFFSHGI